LCYDETQTNAITFAKRCCNLSWNGKGHAYTKSVERRALVSKIMYQIIQFIFAILSRYQGTKAQIRFEFLSYRKKGWFALSGFTDSNHFITKISFVNPRIPVRVPPRVGPTGSNCESKPSREQLTKNPIKIYPAFLNWWISTHFSHHFYIYWERERERDTMSMT